VAVVASRRVGVASWSSGGGGGFAGSRWQWRPRAKRERPHGGGGVSSGGGRAGEVTPFSRGPKFGGGGGCGTLGESGGAGTSDGMAMVGPEL
jgi:hypothetical protein